MSESGQKINHVLMSIPKRAETSAPRDLVDTFVDTGTLEVLLSSRDNQIIYGRRGTGKTHVLVYLAEKQKQKGDIPIYIDLRTIGSTGGMYADNQVPLAERATSLIKDVLTVVHDKLLDYAVANEETINLGVVGPLFDMFIDAVNETTVIGTTSISTETNRTYTAGQSIGASIDQNKISVSMAASESDNKGVKDGSSTVGSAVHTLKFGAIQPTLGKILAASAPKRLWILLDEWSVLPIEVQPFLADMLRRTLFPLQVTVKIAAIEQRTNLQATRPGGDYLGIELGADASADLNLDDFMVFDNSGPRAVDFFLKLLARHYRAGWKNVSGAPELKTDAEFIRFVFTQKTALEELVRAAEGVPRDAINLISLAAQRAVDQNISVENIRGAASAWYSRDKQAAISADGTAQKLLHWIVDEVIAHRRARAFLLLATEEHPLIDKLFDARLLHLLKRNISAHDRPGVRYNVYKIDYGCYVNLLTTAKDPQGLLPSEDVRGRATFADVPPDDYRAIRRAILDLKKFENSI